MERKIKIISGQIELDAVLYGTATAEAVWACLPLHASANTWGDEIYFSIPVQADLEPDARDVVEVGDMGYWPSGAAFCLFFGPTPVSRSGEIRPASAVNVFGKITGQCSLLKQISDGSPVTIQKVE